MSTIQADILEKKKTRRQNYTYALLFSFIFSITIDLRNIRSLQNLSPNSN